MPIDEPNYIQFVRNIVETICEKPEEVKFEHRVDEKGVLIELIVAQEDLGRVIGKKGVTATAIRTLLRVLGARNEHHYSLKIRTDDEQTTSPTPLPDF